MPVTVETVRIVKIARKKREKLVSENDIKGPKFANISR